MQLLYLYISQYLKFSSSKNWWSLQAFYRGLMKNLLLICIENETWLEQPTIEK